MNNRGQSLVLFILIIPIVFLILLAIYDIGRMTLLKLELDNINSIVTEYGIDNITDADIEIKIRELIYKNKSDIDNIEVVIDNQRINVVLKDTIDNRISFFNNFDIFVIESSYTGYFVNQKKIVERNK